MKTTYLIILLLNWIFVNQSMALVDPANYDFSLDSFEVFRPGNSVKQAIEKHGKAELVSEKGKTKTLKFYVAQIRYKFAVIVRVEGDKIVDYHARLPSYFLHDVFHQSMLNRFGAQNFYRLIDGTAIYQWSNKEGINYIYSGTCTITCFPVYLSAYPEEPPFKGYRPLFKELLAPQDFKSSK